MDIEWTIELCTFSSWQNFKMTGWIYIYPWRIYVEYIEKETISYISQL